ncbi:hypothetical protein B7494_g1293 [Chlorociboria aeruginascens]|nr:hypothetical protein B7494_g1293 [Chlorociboria aeruginascens]
MTTPFPDLEPEISSSSLPSRANTPPDVAPDTPASASSEFLRNARRKFTESSIPVGFTNAVGSVSSSLPGLDQVRNGSFSSDGWSGPGQRRNSSAHRDHDINILNSQQNSPAERKKSFASTIPKGKAEGDTKGAATPIDPIPERENSSTSTDQIAVEPSTQVTAHDPSVPYENGYQFPPKHSLWKSTTIFFTAFWKFFITPFGFFVVIYGLNVVAWGGMLFLILINAAPAMCHPSCNNDYSGRKIWLEIDSQILNGLFCVTGLGLIPWRFRDLYYLLQWRWKKDPEGLRRLAGIYRDWFRLEGSQQIPVHWDPKSGVIPLGISEMSVALPIEKSPDPPLTGERAPASKYWTMDFFVWAFFINTLFQFCLCGVMWGLTRFTRPSWVTGVLISFACIIAMAGGYVSFQEGKKVKKVEGVPVSDEDKEILKKMREQDLEKAAAGQQQPQQPNHFIKS